MATITVSLTSSDIPSLMGMADTYGKRGSDEYPDVLAYAVEKLLLSIGESRWYEDDKLRMEDYNDPTATEDALRKSIEKAIGNGVSILISADEEMTVTIKKGV